MNQPTANTRPGRPSLFSVDDLLRPDDEEYNDQIREAYCRGSVAMESMRKESNGSR